MKAMLHIFILVCVFYETNYIQQKQWLWKTNKTISSQHSFYPMQWAVGRDRGIRKGKSGRVTTTFNVAYRKSLGGQVMMSRNVCSTQARHNLHWSTIWCRKASMGWTSNSYGSLRFGNKCWQRWLLMDSWSEWTTHLWLLHFHIWLNS